MIVSINKAHKKSCALLSIGRSFACFICLMLIRALALRGDVMKGHVLIAVIALCLFAQGSHAQDEKPLSVEIDKQVERSTETQPDVPILKDVEQGPNTQKSDAEKAPAEEGVVEEEGAKELVGQFEGTVTRILDADKIEIDNRRMRLLGVNAPEKIHVGNTAHCYSDEATHFLEALLSDKKVTYSYDITYGRRDRFGDRRIYLYYNGIFVNAELIEKGQAFADTSKNYSAREEFISLQQIALRKHLGLWHTCPVECDRGGVCRAKTW
jgi:endonuclease YncB( thermonuclease family)